MAIRGILRNKGKARATFIFSNIKFAVFRFAYIYIQKVNIVSNETEESKTSYLTKRKR